MRPTERPHEGIVALADREAADWLETRAHAALLFWDESDDASRRLRARLQLVAAAAGVPVGAIDVRQDALVAQALGVKGVPEVIVFRGGEVVDRVMGVAPEHILREALSRDHRQ